MLPLLKNSQKQIAAIFLVLLTCLTLFVGCDISDKLSQQLAKITSKKADKLARNYIDLLFKADIDQAEELLDPRIVTAETSTGLRKCSEDLNKEELISMKIVGLSVIRNTQEDKIINHLTYRCYYIRSPNRCRLEHRATFVCRRA